MRLFTGISLPQPILETMGQALAQLRPTADIHWSPLENLHITTKFIGTWPQERLEELDRALAGLPARHPIPIRIARYGYFPNPHRPHTFFAGIQADEDLRALAAELESLTTALGHPPDPRDYTPHLTLARIKTPDFHGLRQHIAEHGAPEFGTFVATEFHLYESIPGPRGSVYHKLKTYPFQEATTI